MSEWQTIETAPKDGTPFLAYTPSKIEREYIAAYICDNYALCVWNHGAWCAVEAEDNGYAGGEMTGWCEDWELVRIDPTHWMPLPEPPHPEAIK